MAFFFAGPFFRRVGERGFAAAFFNGRELPEIGKESIILPSASRANFVLFLEMKVALPTVLAILSLALLSACKKSPETSAPVSPTPTPTAQAPSPTPQNLPYRPPVGPPSLAPQATPGSQAPGLNDQQKVERLFQEAN